MAKSSLKHFLIVFDRRTGRQLRLDEFADSSEALRAYEAAEDSKGQDRMIDVVLVGSDSLDTVRVTHSSYFREGLTASNVEEYLRQFALENGLPEFMR